MADEVTRKIKQKKIKLDSGTVAIPVISQISFIDEADRGWETQYTIDNTTDADRDVHVAIVKGDGTTDESGSGDPSTGLSVERIDRFRLLDAADRGREIFPEPDSKTVAQPPDAPPYFTTHVKTHVVKYINHPDNGQWIKSELIDQIAFLDTPDRGQETQFTLANPPDNQGIDGLIFGVDPDDSSQKTIAVDPSIEEITSGVGGSGSGDKPARTDPFQNIVGFGQSHVVSITWNFIPAITFGPPPATTGMTLVTPAYPAPKSTPDFSYTDSATATAAATSDPVRPDGVVSQPPWVIAIPNGGTDLIFNGGTSLSKSVPLYDGTFPVDGTASASIAGTTVTVTDTSGVRIYHCYATQIVFRASRSGDFQYQGSIFVTAYYEPGT
jgi:hypothetical protein